jgi:hypothetical protein
MWASDWPAVAIPPTYEPTSGSRWHPGLCGVAARRAERLLLVKRYANVYSVEGSRRHGTFPDLPSLGERRACLPATLPPTSLRLLLSDMPPRYISHGHSSPLSCSFFSLLPSSIVYSTCDPFQHFSPSLPA